MLQPIVISNNIDSFLNLDLLEVYDLPVAMAIKSSPRDVEGESCALAPCANLFIKFKI